MRRILPLVLAVACAPALEAQTLGQMTRTSAITGLNDTALVYSADSAGKTRAATTHQLFLRPAATAAKPAFSFALDSTTGFFRAGAQTIGFATNALQTMTLSGGAAATLSGGAGNMTVTAGTGASRTLTLQTTTAASAAKNTLILGADSSAAFLGAGTFGGLLTGSNGVTVASGKTLTLTGATVAGAPTWSSVQTFAAGQLVDSATGAARSQKLTTARTIGGTSFDGTANITPALSDSSTGAARSQTLTTSRALWGQSFNGSAAITGSLTSVGDITGGASNMAVQAGTGASRTLTLSATNASSAATSSVVLAADSTVTFNGKIVGADSLSFSAASPRIVGGAGNMTIQAGTGASRTLTLQSTTSGSVAKNTLVLGADTSTTFLGNAIFNGNGTASAVTIQGGNAGYGVYFTGGGLFTVAGGGVQALQVDASANTQIGQNIAIASGKQVRTGDGTATVPSYSFSNMKGLGLFGGGTSTADTLYMATDSVESFKFLGGATAKMVGGAGNMTIVAGTGNSRTITLQSTNSSGTAQTGLTINSSGVAVNNLSGMQLQVPDGTLAAPGVTSVSDGDTGFFRGNGDNPNDSLVTVVNGLTSFIVKQDTTIITKKLRATTLTTEPSTKSTLCIDGTTFEVLINAAATCTVSSRRFKHDIAPLSPTLASQYVGQLRPSTFTYNADGQRGIGLIAEEADSVDHRLASRDTQGRVTSVNYEQVTILLLAEVQRLRLTVDSLRSRVRVEPKRALTKTASR